MNMTDAMFVANQLGGATNHENYVTCKCPCHDDKTASLSIQVGRGVLLYTCFAGCARMSIIHELIRRGLHMPIGEPQWHRAVPVPVEQPVAAAEAPPANYEPSAQSKPDPKLVCTYTYVDEQGVPLYEVDRYEPKNFRQHGVGKFNMEGVRRVLYNLPSIIASKQVIILEGEKDADTVTRLGFCGTTNSGGCGANATWDSISFIEPLKDKEVIVIPDHDKRGQERGELIAKIVGARIVQIPDGFKDISEWNPTKQQLEELINKPDIELSMDSKGKLYLNLDNAARILSEHSEFKGKIWLDSFAEKIKTTWNCPERDWKDEDNIAVQVYFQRELALANYKKDSIEAAVIHVAKMNARDPLKEYLHGLQWDGIERIEHFFQDVYGADDTEYVRACGRAFLCGMVGRGMVRGCQMDYMVVLEGSQGVNKTKSLQALGKQWYADSAIPVQDKDFYMQMRGKWLIEISELQSFGKTDIRAIKQMLTCKTDSYRSPYGRHVADHPRGSVLVGTTNEESFLRDPSGGRRFLPITCHGIDPEIIEIYRDNYFAEAKVVFEKNHQWWHLPEEEAKKEQRARYEHDSWQEPILEYVKHCKRVTISEVMKNALNIEVGRQTNNDQRRVSDTLKIMGWTKLSARDDEGTTRRFWMAPEVREVVMAPQVKHVTGYNTL